MYGGWYVSYIVGGEVVCERFATWSELLQFMRENGVKISKVFRADN